MTVYEMAKELILRHETNVVRLEPMESMLVRTVLANHTEILDGNEALVSALKTLFNKYCLPKAIGF
jgi:hypothetical protein